MFIPNKNHTIVLGVMFTNQSRSNGGTTERCHPDWFTTRR